MTMQEQAATRLKMCARDCLAPRSVGIERGGPQHDVLAVESAVALTNGHDRLMRVVPDRGEAIRLRIKPGDSGPGRLRAVWIDEAQILLQKLAGVHHDLLAGALRDDGRAGRRHERPDDVPVAGELCKELLTGARRVRWLVLLLRPLTHDRTGKEYCGENPS